jgi:hypothetical protein
MAVTITVGGTDRTEYWKRDRTNFEVITNGRGKASAIVFDVPVGDAFRPVDGQVIVILEDAVVRYRGILLEPEEEELGDRDQNRFVRFDAAASDYNLIADRRIVAAEYEATAFEDIVDDIVTTYLTGEGITQTGVEAGETIDKLVLNYVTVTEAFNQLSEITGKAWFIDEDKDLNFADLTSVPAPADLDGAIALRDTVKIRPDRQKYRNRQTILAGTEMFPIVATAEDAAEIAARAALEGTSGIYERVTEAGADITSGDVALEYGGDLIARFSEVPKIIELDTRTAGFRAGQSATADFPNNDVDDVPCFIEEVNGYINEELDEVWYSIRATTGDPFGSWMEYFRKDEKTKPPFQIGPPDPGEFDLIAITPGPVVHDPPPADFEWFQGSKSSASLSPNAIGITDAGDFVVTARRGGSAGSGGCPGGEFPGCTGVCHASARQMIIEKWAIDPVTREPASSPSGCGSFDVFNNGTNVKQQLYISPDGTMCAVIQTATPSVDSKLGVFSLESMSLLGSVVTSMGTNANSSEGVWSSDGYIYVVDGSANLYVFDVTTPTAPTEAQVLATSIAGLRSLVFSPDESVIYGCGGDPQGAAFDRSSPAAVTEDTLLTLGLSLESWDLNDDGTALVGFLRLNSTTVGWTTIDVVKNTTTITANTQSSVALSTTAMDGKAVIFAGVSAVCFSEENVGSVSNSLKAYRWDCTDLTAVTVEETFSWNHGISGNKGPLKNATAVMDGYIFDFGPKQLLYGVAGYTDVVPLTIDRPLRAGFGGTGIGVYEPGDILYASGVVPIGNPGRYHGALGRLPIGTTGQHLISSGGLPVWADDAGGGGGGDTANNELISYLGTELEVLSGTLQEVSGLSVNVAAGSKYAFRAELFIEADYQLGAKYVMGGTAVGTAIYQIRTTDDDTGVCSTLISGQLNALHPTASAVGASGMLRGFTEIMGSIDVTSSGTLVPMFATLNDP